MRSNYDPSQPRVPAGHPEGGRWTNKNWSGDASVAEEAARSGAGLPPKDSHQKKAIKAAPWGVGKHGQVYLGEILGSAYHRWSHGELAGMYGFHSTDAFIVRGLYGEIIDDFDRRFDFVSFYTLNGNCPPDVFFEYEAKIIKELSLKLGRPDYSPAIYRSDDFFYYRLWGAK